MPRVTFDSPGNESFTVPTGVYYVILHCWGAQGSGGPNGGYNEARLPVTPGDTLNLRVGEQGSQNNSYPEGELEGGGFPNGGGAYFSGSHDGGGHGGGGSSDVRHPSSSRGDNIVQCAGAGGGDGSASGDDGDAGPADSGNGGRGGGAQGEGENGGGAETHEHSVDGGEGGGSGSFQGENGSIGGVDSHDHHAAGGAGGGGVNGGEAGDHAIRAYNDSQVAGGGGGGDGYLDPVLSNTSTQVGAKSGHGRIRIEYSPEVRSINAATGRNEIDLTWNRPHSECIGYDVYRAQSSGGKTTADYSHIASIGSGNNTSYTNTGLEDGERYYYRVRANYSGEDNVVGREADATTYLPSGTITAVTTTGHEVTIDWQKDDNSSDGGFEIERRLEGQSSWSSITSGLSLGTTSYTDSTVTNGETYEYRLTRNTQHIGASTAVEKIPAAGFLVTTLTSVRQTVEEVFETEK